MTRRTIDTNAGLNDLIDHYAKTEPTYADRVRLTPRAHTFKISQVTDRDRELFRIPTDPEFVREYPDLAKLLGMTP